MNDISNEELSKTSKIYCFISNKNIQMVILTILVVPVLKLGESRQSLFFFVLNLYEQYT